MRNFILTLLFSATCINFSWSQSDSPVCILDGLQLEVTTLEGECGEGSSIAIASLTGSGTSLTGSGTSLTGSGTSLTGSGSGINQSIRYSWEYVDDTQLSNHSISESPSLSDTAYLLKSGLYLLTAESGPECMVQAEFEFQSSINDDNRSICQIAYNEENNTLSAIEINANKYIWSLNNEILYDGNYPSIDIGESGLYNLTIISEEGCYSECEIFIPEKDPCTENVLKIELDTKTGECGNKGNSLTIYITDGMPPYTYTLMYEDPASGLSIITEEVSEDVIELNDVASGPHYLELTDARGCFVDEMTVIEQTEPCTDLCEEANLELELEVEYYECKDTFNQLTINFSGGTGPYTYIWMHNGSSEIIEIDEASSEITTTIYNVSEGLHELIITDINGCTADGSIEISEKEKCEDKCTDNPVDIELDVLYLECSDTSNILLAHFFGGEAPYTYIWTYEGQEGEVTIINEESFGTVNEEVNVPKGIHTFEITDSRGCTAISSIRVDEGHSCEDVCEDNPVDVELEVLYFKCRDTTNMLMAHFFGGEAPYRYKWTHESEDGDINVINEESFGSIRAENNIAPGIHTFEIIDSRGCKATKRIEVEETEPCTDPCIDNVLEIAIDLDYNPCGDNGNTITLEFKSGKAPYSYSWSYVGANGVLRTTEYITDNLIERIEDAPAGQHVFMLIDGNGCTAIEGIEIQEKEETSPCEIIISDDRNELYVDADEEAIVHWYFNQEKVAEDSRAISITENGVYSVKIENTDGCTSQCEMAIDHLDVCASSDLKVMLEAHYFECSDSLNVVSALALDGEAPYRYTFSILPAESDILDLIEREGVEARVNIADVPEALVIVDVIDANGCMAQAMLEIEKTEAVKACEINISDDQSTLSVDAPSTAYVKWFYNNERINEESTSTIMIEQSGLYGVMIYYENGCITECEMDVEVTTTPPDDSASDIECSFEMISNTDFEIGWDAWKDGGSDAALMRTNDLSGAAAVRIRDNSGKRSSIYSEILDLSKASALKVNFDFLTKSMEPNEDFLLEYSIDGGKRFKIIDSWYRANEGENSFQNKQKVAVAEEYSISDLNDLVVLRIRCDASNNGDKVFIDNLIISACINSEDNTSTSDDEENHSDDTDDDMDDEVTDETDNYNIDNCLDRVISDENFENGRGVWNDGGSDMSRKFDRKYFNSNVIRLRDNSGKRSSMYTNSIDLLGAKYIRLEFSYVTINLTEGERFVFEYSLDGGVTYTELEEWETKPGGYQNGQIYDITSFYELPESSENAVFRLRADASANNDKIYIDNLKVHTCGGTSAQSTTTKNEGKSIIDKETLAEIEYNVIEEIDLEVKAYPNPTIDYINLKWNTTDVDIEINIDIYNTIGAKVISTKESSLKGQKTIDLSRIPEGMYFIQLRSENYTSELIKVIKN